MWQRIQTLFLAISIVALLISLFQPVWIFQPRESTEAVLTPFYFFNAKTGDYLYMPYSITAILTIASITVSFTTIRKFNNRLTQLKLGALNSFLLLGVFGSAFFFGRDLIHTSEGGQYGIGFFLPGISVVCNFLANTFIRRDEKLVRESDRLR